MLLRYATDDMANARAYDYTSATPLMFAMEAGHPACVRLLLPRTCVLPSFTTVVEGLQWQSTPTAFDEIATMFLEELAVRRQRLSELALCYLNERDVAMLELRQAKVLDAKAWDCWKQLQDAGIHVPEELEMVQHARPPTVFFCCGVQRVDSRLLQQLWDLGFPDVDQQRGDTSVWDEVLKSDKGHDYGEAQLGVPNWLASHGVMSDTSALLSFAARFSWLFTEEWHDDETLTLRRSTAVERRISLALECVARS